MVAEQRLATIAALVMLATLFLPWYETSVVVVGEGRFVHEGFNGFGSADFVLASVVLVALAVLAMMLARGEGRGFHLPGGDGVVVMVAGTWAAILIFYRVIDHPDLGDEGTRVGIQWGVFVAFLAAAFLVYAGFRIRIAHRPEPPLPLDEPPPARAPEPRAPRPAGAAEAATPEVARRPRPPAPAPAPAPDQAPTRRVGRRRPPEPVGDEPPIPGQLSFDEAETQRLKDR